MLLFEDSQKKLFEKGFVILTFLIYTEAMLPIIKELSVLAPNGTYAVTRVLFLVIKLVIIFLVAVWRKRIVRTVTKEKLLWALVGIALTSVLWSAAPECTLHRIKSLLWTTLFGVYFAARYSLKEQLRLLGWALAIAALLSLVFALVLPKWGVMGMSDINTRNAITHVGAWRGIYIGRNILGRIMVLSSVVLLLVAFSRCRYHWLVWSGFSLSVCLILLSGSKASLAVLLTLIVFLLLYRALRWNYASAVSFFIAVIFVSVGLANLLIVNAGTIVGAFGRDLTFTGRTAIWAAVLEKIWQRPLLGYGYGGFWNGWQSQAADVWRILEYEPPHAHNGFLDLWLELGLLGLLAFLISFLTVYLKAIILVRRTKTAEGFWPLAYLTFLLLANIAESAFLRQPCFWILYVSVTLSMHNNQELYSWNLRKAEMQGCIEKKLNLQR